MKPGVIGEQACESEIYNGTCSVNTNAPTNFELKYMRFVLSRKSIGF